MSKRLIAVFLGVLVSMLIASTAMAGSEWFPTARAASTMRVGR